MKFLTLGLSSVILVCLSSHLHRRGVDFCFLFKAFLLVKYCLFSHAEQAVDSIKFLYV